MGETIRIQEAAGDTNAHLAPARATPGRAGPGTVLATADDAKAFLTSIGQGDAHDGALNQDRIMGSAEAALDHLLAHLTSAATVTNDHDCQRQTPSK